MSQVTTKLGCRAFEIPAWMSRRAIDAGESVDDQTGRHWPVPRRRRPKWTASGPRSCSWRRYPRRHVLRRWGPSSRQARRQALVVDVGGLRLRRRGVGTLAAMFIGVIGVAGFCIEAERALSRFRPYRVVSATSC